MNKEIYKNTFINTSLRDSHEPELFETINYLLKQKKIYLFFSSLSLIIGILFYLKSPKIWEGEFQIVIGSDKENSSNPLSKLKKLGGESNLNTDIKILESPSTLQPVYDFVKDIKKDKKDLPKDIYSWLDNFKIVKVKNTSIINVSYFDQDRELIIPVLNRVINIYRNYSYSNKQASINLGLKYLEEQVKIANKKADNSLKEFQNFALKEGIGDIDGLQIKGDLNINSKIIMPKMPKMTEMPINNFQTISEPVSNSIAKRYQEHKIKLAKFEAEIIENKSIYKDESIVMQNLILKRDTFKNAISRPKVVFLKFRDLEKKASKDQTILNSLESQLSIMKLEKARTLLPWKLISNPTIFETYVSPRKIKTITPFFLLGLFVPTTILLIKKIISGKISDLKYLKNLIKLPLIKTFSTSDQSISEESIKLIIKNGSFKNNMPLLLDFCNKKNKKDNFSNLIKLFDDYKFEIKQNVEDCFENNQIILIVRSENITNRLLENLDENSYYINNKLVGWILLKD